MATRTDVLAKDASTTRGSPVVRVAKDICFGSVAGMVSKVFEHPFDLTKVRLQSQVLDASARFKGPVDCLVQTWKYEGIRGLYRGLPAPIVGAMAENATLFLSYNEIQNFMRWTSVIKSDESIPLPFIALAGGGAGAVTSFVLTPIELVKCKMQVQMLVVDPLIASAARPIPLSAAVHIPSSAPTNPRKLPGPISVFMFIIRSTGFRGLWLGQTGTLIREGGGSAVWFSTKEYVASLLTRRRIPTESAPRHKMVITPLESAVSGACAGAAYNLAFFPADTVKSSLQTEEELRPRGPGVPRSTFFGMFKEMYMKQGIRGLYAGCGITIVRSIPSSAIIFLIYDGLNRRFG